MILANQDPGVPKEEALMSALVQAGEERSFTTLPFDLRLFLIDCLIEYLDQPAIVHRVLALDLAAASNKSGAVLRSFLRQAGDASLLLTGLFPKRAEALNVSPRYFASMGQMFYGTLADQLSATPRHEQGAFYRRVAREFLLLARVLQHTRGCSDEAMDAYRRFRTQIN